MAFASLICPNCGGKDIDMNHEGTITDPYECKICRSKLTFKDNAFHMVIDNNPTQTSLLDRAKIELSAGNFEYAAKSIDQLLDINPKCAEAYMIRLCAKESVTDIDSLTNVYGDITKKSDYQTALRFAVGNQKERWEKIAEKNKTKTAQRQKREDEEKSRIDSINDMQSKKKQLEKKHTDLVSELQEITSTENTKDGPVKTFFTSLLAVGYFFFVIFWAVGLAIAAVLAFLTKTNFFFMLFVVIVIYFVGTIIYINLKESKSRSKIIDQKKRLQSNIEEVKREIDSLDDQIRKLSL